MDTAALALVEEDIIKQKVVLSRLYSRKNSFSFVSRLANKTLADIFIHCARDCFYHGKRHYYYRMPPSWCNVSYVCRRWRDIALNCATLWAFISTMSPRWIEELLERSNKASLRIRINIPETRILQSLDTITKAVVHMARIQELQLSLPSKDAGRILAILSSHAPRLQSLKISTPSELPSSVVLFGGDTPSLRTLELENIRVPFSLLNICSLTTLRLRGQFQNDMKDFLSTLGYMDGLIHLCLDDVFPRCSEFISSPAFKASPRVRLPYLSQLLIIGPISTVIALLSSLDFPLKAIVRLASGSDIHSSLEDYALLGSVLAHRYMSTDRELFIPTIRSLVIQFLGGRLKLTCSASGRGCDFDDPPREDLGWDCNIPFQISFHNSWLDDHNDIIGDICHALPLAHVQNVHVVDPPDSSNFWKRAFGHLQELRYIKLSEGEMPNLASMLVEPLHGFAENNVNQIFAPALEVVELYDIGFPLRYPYNKDTFGPNEQSLRKALATRKDRQVQLIMYGCFEKSEDEPSEAEEDDDYYHCQCHHGCRCRLYY